MMSDEKIKNFVSNINSLTSTNVREVLESTYSKDIDFIDPVRSIAGLEKLTEYFQTLYSRVESCQFTISNQIQDQQEFSLQWNMQLRHKGIAKNRPIVIDGASFLKFEKDKVSYHQDYYDLGALVYERLPILGKIVKKVRNAI